MMESPDAWAQAPMQGETSVSAAVPVKPENSADKPVESAAAEVAKPAPPEVAQPAAPKVEKPAAPEVAKTAVPVSGKKGDFPTATPVKGWNGFVYSPYNSRWINVKDVTSGSLVADPRFAIEEKKYFLVP